MNRRDGIKVKILETGQEFNSVVACADYLGIDPSWISKVVSGSGLYSCHGYHIVKADSDELIQARRQGRPGVRVRCIETNIVYDSMTACCEQTGVSPGVLWEILHTLNGRKTYKGLHYILA